MARPRCTDRGSAGRRGADGARDLSAVRSVLTGEGRSRRARPGPAGCRPRSAHRPGDPGGAARGAGRSAARAGGRRTPAGRVRERQPAGRAGRRTAGGGRPAVRLPHR
ncbi:hypothetical protein E1298_00340 [Actinomadura rubrisoli]|uniref:Uncharacterized protein n=1 Tax=Actinomadura rubrisoli TaxID=2530368 RepID=A0A4R5CGG5_9ACTN|nr:hypothetical protein E1298_00340 [Actinomadura rubrisoli]